MPSVQIVAVENNGVTFEGDTDDLPLFAPAILGKVVENVNMNQYDSGDIIHEFDPSEL